MRLELGSLSRMPKAAFRSVPAKKRNRRATAICRLPTCRVGMEKHSASELERQDDRRSSA